MMTDYSPLRCSFVAIFRFILVIKSMLRLILFIFLGCAPILAFGQIEKKVTEVGVTFNVLNYSGDLAEARFVFKTAEEGFGISVRRQVSKPLFLTGSLIFGRISGDDANNSGAFKDRQYRFFSRLTEFAVVGEWHPFWDKLQIGTSGNRISPFIFLGGGIALAKPEADYYGPGNSPFPEPDPQNLFLALPIGGGVRAEFYENLSLSLSLGWRPVFSDKLDGVSVYGDKSNNDWYSNIQVGVFYRLFVAPN
jgi:hypothetical protein